MDLLSHLRSLDDRPITRIHVEEWQCDVYLRAMSAADRLEISLAALDDKRKGHIGLMALAASLCDEHGNPICDDKAELITLLAERNGAVVERLIRAAFEISALSETSTEAIRKN